MRRKASGGPRNSATFDLKQDIDPDIIWGIGASCLLWNTIEATIDVSMALAVDLPAPTWLSVTSRINGIDGKISIIKEAAQHRLSMPPKIYQPIAATLGSIEEHKKYRDALIHARILHPKDSVAPSFLRRGEEWEVLVTKDAINALCKRLGCLRDEIEDVLMIFHFAKIWSFIKPEFPDAEAQKRSVEADLSKSLAQLHRHQQMRNKLPPLPKFPDEPPIPTTTEGAQSPPA